MEYRKILVALDHSSQGETVFEEAVDLAQRYGAQLILLNCLPLVEPELNTYSDLYGQELVNFSTAMQESQQGTIEEARQWLTEYCQKATERGVATQWDCLIGDADRSICEFAQSNEIDLIVLGRRGRSGLAELFLGSVSNYVLHHAHCSVLVIQGREAVPEPDR